MSLSYPRLGVHRVSIVIPSLPAPDERWAVKVEITVRNGRLVEWLPDEFIYRGSEEAETRFSPAALDSPLPRLVARLCTHAETWFQAERDRVDQERRGT